MFLTIQKSNAENNIRIIVTVKTDIKPDKNKYLTDE